MAPIVGTSHAKAGKRPVDLLLADHSNMDCELLKTALRRYRTHVDVVACAVTRAEVIELVKAHSPDIALISETLQDGPFTGMGVLRDVHNSFPKTKIIALLKSSSDDLVVDAFRAGAKGVFCRAEPLPVLHKCIDAVHQGQIWANSKQLGSVLDAFVNAAPLRLVNARGRALFTKREKDVVNLVIQGYTNRDIAEKLRLTEHTVSNYLFRIYEKVGISSRVELVLYALGEERT